MNVYIGTSGELKNDYIGEVYEYSYDFRGKTVAQVQSDGWTTVSGFACDSNGCYSSSWGNTSIQIPELTNARKITLFGQLYQNGTSIGLQLRDTPSSSTYQTGFYVDRSVTYNVQIDGGNLSYSTVTQPTINNFTMTIDLENLTWNVVYGTFSQNGTITATNASHIKNCRYIRMANGETGRCQKISILVE